MVSGDYTIVNERGLHARAAARFVHLASGFKSKITVRCDDAVADGKSILSLMVLGCSQGKHLHVSTEGDDEVEALAAVAGLLEAGFDDGP